MASGYPWLHMMMRDLVLKIVHLHFAAKNSMNCIHSKGIVVSLNDRLKLLDYLKIL